VRKNEGGCWARRGRRGCRLKKETMRLVFKAALRGENILEAVGRGKGQNV
jgi:hypothetical protein